MSRRLGGPAPLGICLLCSLAALGCDRAASVPSGEQPAPRVGQDSGARGLSLRVEVDAALTTADLIGMTGRQLSAIRQAKDLARSQAVAVYVGHDEDASLPSMLGTFEVVDERLRFHPRFALDADTDYRFVLRPDRLPKEAETLGQASAVTFRTPAAPQRPLTRVTHVYPTTAELPENQLKFYLHFSAPMSRGEAYRRIRLFDEQGRQVDGAFLELDEELWDPAQQRFTLLFDPGRVKRGLRPREELGPVLAEGKRYQLIVDDQWPDARGKPLEKSYEKSFQVGPADETPIDPRSWKIEAPPALSRDALVVRFGEPLDHALAQRMLVVAQGESPSIDGDVELVDDERTWRFVPKQPWTAGQHRLAINTALEDLAGNAVGRAFDVDVFDKVDRNIPTETVEIPFEISLP